MIGYVIKTLCFPRQMWEIKSRFSHVRHEVLESTIRAFDHDRACLIKDVLNDGEFDSFKVTVNTLMNN